MDADGYLFMRNVLDPETVRAARRSFISKLQEAEALAPGTDPMEGRLRDQAPLSPMSTEFARKNAAVERVVFGAEIKDFYTKFVGGPVRHFDFIWVRSLGRGKGTPPHCDIVYMGRGTHRLYTAWIPYGEVGLDVGGLMILEKSHTQSDRIRKYLASDVDSYCENRPEGKGEARPMTGVLSKNPVSLREKFGGRWLTSEYRMGDLLTFRMDLIHASIDNSTDRIRLSTDTRYQRSDEPIDERWIGRNPVGHGPAGKRRLIC